MDLMVCYLSSIETYGAEAVAIPGESISNSKALNCCLVMVGFF